MSYLNLGHFPLISAFLIILSACDVNITQTPPTGPVTSTKVPADTGIITPPQSCPVLVPSDGTSSEWTCTSNCTQIPFTTALFGWSQMENFATHFTYGITELTATYPDGHQIKYALSETQNHDAILNGNLELTILGDPTPPTIYPASLDCDQITINDAVFTYVPTH